MKDIVIKIPNSLSEIKLIQFQHIAELKQNYKDELECRLQIISYLSGNSITDLRKRSISTLSAIDLTWITSYNLTPKKIIDTFFIGKIKYIRCDLKNESADFHIGFQELYKENSIKNTTILIAMIYRPVEKIFRLGQKPTFKIKDFDLDTLYDRANLFANKLPASIYESVISFFLSSQMTILKNMLVSLEQQLPKMKDCPAKVKLTEKIEEIRSLTST